jgi:uncharacterized membrane protein YphA (DoxX/SURF4 family)
LKFLRNRIVHGAVSVLLGALFVYASLDKIAQPREFAKIVYRYQVVGPSATLGVAPANVLAATLPWIEAVAGALLIVGVWRREAASVVAVLLVVFMVAVGSVVARGIDVGHCGCFSVGGEGRSAGLLLLAQDLGLLLLAVYLIVVRPAGPAPSLASAPVRAGVGSSHSPS